MDGPLALLAAIARKQIALREQARDEGIYLRDTPQAWPLPPPQGDIEAYEDWLLEQQEEMERDGRRAVVVS